MITVCVCGAGHISFWFGVGSVWQPVDPIRGGRSRWICTFTMGKAFLQSRDAEHRGTTGFIAFVPGFQIVLKVLYWTVCFDYTVPASVSKIS